MKLQDELIALLRRYFNREHRARLAIFITSADHDHAALDELLKNQQPSGVYVDTFAGPHHGSEDAFRGVIHLLKFWRSRGRVIVHRDVKAGSRILIRPVRTDRPPQVAEFILLLIPKRNREHLVGDLEEEYRDKVLPKWGRFRAQFFYWEQTAIAVICYLWPVLKRILGLAAILKVIGR